MERGRQKENGGVRNDEADGEEGGFSEVETGG